MTNTLLLSWTKLKQYTDINDSLDAALIKNGIREAQDIQLQRVIGTLLYEKLLNLVETETIDDSENAQYKTLLDSYVQDMLLYASYYNLLEFTFIRTRNNGLLTPQGGENSASVDKSTYEMKRTSTQSKFEYYADRLARYITEEQSDFIELNANTLLYQQNADYASQFRSPIIFSQTTRAKYLDFAHRAGLPIVNSAFPQYPPLNN
tara:strand:+ start:172 stop:789 length:618 start_codon:yes stop_codon:yes gene_type:complete